MLVYGKNVAKEILKNPKKIRKIYLEVGFDDKYIISLIEKNKISYIYKSKSEIDHLVNGLHQGIILDATDYKYHELGELLDEDVVVILDHLEDPHNFGAIVRTCEAAGIKSIIIPKDRQVQVNATVMKTSVGTLENVKIIQVTNLVNTIKELKKNNFWIVGTALDDSIDYRKIDYSGKIVLIIGNEGTGMSRIVKDQCDFIAKIPMYGTTNSLNASVAGGIMIYEVIRNRK